MVFLVIVNAMVYLHSEKKITEDRRRVRQKPLTDGKVLEIHEVSMPGPTYLTNDIDHVPTFLLNCNGHGPEYEDGILRAVSATAN